MRSGHMEDGYWDEERRRFIPPSTPFTVAVRRSIACCTHWLSDEEGHLRFKCAGCLDRTLSEDR